MHLICAELKNYAESRFFVAPGVVQYTHCAYSKPTYLFYRYSIIIPEDGTQHGDPVALTLFAETIQTLVKKLDSKINLW